MNCCVNDVMHEGVCYVVSDVVSQVVSHVVCGVVCDGVGGGVQPYPASNYIKYFI